MTGVLGRGWNLSTPRSAAKKSAKKKVAQSKQDFHVIIPKPVPPKRKREGATPAVRLTYDPAARTVNLKAWWQTRKAEELKADGLFGF